MTLRSVVPYLISNGILFHTCFYIDSYSENGHYIQAVFSLFATIAYFCIVQIVCDFLFGHTYSVIYLRKFLYQWITNKRLQRYLDSIFLIRYYLLNFDSGTHQNERWKNYIFSLLTFPLTLFLLLLPSVTAFITYIILHLFKLFKFGGKVEKENFDFEVLPFSLQDRFIELQSPLTKKQLKQIYPWIKNDELVIDKLHIDAERKAVDQELVKYMHNKFMVLEEIEWKNISESWNFAQTYFERKTLLVVRFENGRKKNWNLEWIKALKIVKTAIFTSLKPFEFQYLYNNLNLSLISELEIKYSNLSLKEFALIKHLNLKSIYLIIKLENGYSNPEMIEFIFETFVKIPKIRVFFEFFYEGSFFETFIVDWILKNGYRESFTFTFQLHKSPWYLTFASDSLIISGFNCYQLSLQ